MRISLQPYAQGVSLRRSAAPVTLSSASGPMDKSEVSRVQPPSPETLCAATAAALPGPVGACCAVLATELSYEDLDGWDKAEAYYERVRGCEGDVAEIARHTPYSEKQVNTIKDHLFYNLHELDDGLARFDADPLIANSWSRLSQGTHGPKDLQLLEHELFEARFESLFNTDYRTAHDAANRSGRPSGL